MTTSTILSEIAQWLEYVGEVLKKDIKFNIVSIYLYRSHETAKFTAWNSESVPNPIQSWVLLQKRCRESASDSEWEWLGHSDVCA